MKTVVGNSASALILALKDPAPVLQAISRSSLLSTSNGIGQVAVHWTLDNVRKLTRLGLWKAPAPIAVEYQWPGMHRPFDHQKTSAAFLAANVRAYNFSEAGTGKTNAAIWAADYLMSKNDIRRVLVICPVSTMRHPWASEVFNSAMHRTVAVCHGSRSKREEIAANRDFDIVIINYDGVPIIKDTLAKSGFDLIIIDEANYLKNVSTRRWRAVNEIVSPSTRVWMMTATPASQSPEDAYGLAKLMTPDRVPRFFGRWRDRVMMQVTKFRYAPKPTATAEVNRVLQPAIRFKKSDCLDLPEMTFQTRHVPLTDQQRRYYNQLRKQLLIEAGGEKIRAVHAAAGMTKLLQLSLGTVYSEDGNVVEFDGSNRLRAMLDVIDESAHKVIVFVPYRHTIDVVRAAIEAENYKTDTINGSVPMNARGTIINRFQTEADPKVLIIQPHSASHGITLTAADTIIWFGPVASVETWIQANERINRPSQKNKMTVVKLCGSPVEEKVYNALESKELDQLKLVSLYENIIKG